MQSFLGGLQVGSRQHYQAATMSTPMSLRGFQAQRVLQQHYPRAGIFASNKSPCWHPRTSKGAERLAGYQSRLLKSASTPLDGVQTENDSTSTNEESESSTTRGGEAGPGPGSTLDAAIEEQSPVREPRKTSFIQKLIQALGWPFFAATQFLGSLLKWLVPDIKLRRRVVFASLMLLGGAFTVIASGGVGSKHSPIRVPQEVVYSQFLQLVKQGSVRSVRMDDSTSRAYFDVLPDQQTQQALAHAGLSKGGRDIDLQAGRVFYTKCIGDPHLIPLLISAGVEFGAIKASIQGAASRVILSLMALWIPLMPLFFFTRHLLNTRGGSRTKKPGGAPQSTVMFKDVAGVDGALAELREIVACLRDASAYAKMGARMPAGVLLSGPPGTGKTLLAKAVAGEARVPFFACSASEFVEMFVGRGAARIRDLFAEARKCAPSVVFIDELDAIGGRRGAGLNEERDQTLNQLADGAGRL
eukprot:jgi/Botrbrau1/3436/Bobra.139_1s0016.1